MADGDQVAAASVIPADAEEDPNKNGELPLQ
jgi:hypothetical protein